MLVKIFESTFENYDRGTMLHAISYIEGIKFALYSI